MSLEEVVILKEYDLSVPQVLGNSEEPHSSIVEPSTLRQQILENIDCTTLDSCEKVSCCQGKDSDSLELEVHAMEDSLENRNSS